METTLRTGMVTPVSSCRGDELQATAYGQWVVDWFIRLRGIPRSPHVQVALELADLDPGWLFIFIPISNVSDVSLQKLFIVLGFATRLLRPMEMLALELSRAQFLFSKWTIYRWWSGDWPAGKDLPSGALYRVSGHVQQDSHVNWTLAAL